MSSERHIIFLFLVCLTLPGRTQCLSSVNPVGGTENLLVLERKAFRINAFYKYGQGNRYFEGSQVSDFNLIDRAWYNYLSTHIGYGISKGFTLEAETGFYLNKTQKYNVQPGYSLRGWGFNYVTLLGKINLYTDYVKRRFIALGAGVKIPCRRKMQTVDNVQLPIEIQPSSGAFGLTANASLVKEDSERGLRFFLTNRTEIYAANLEDYRLGSSVFSAVFISKHLMHHRIRGDWTCILQMRNEIRGKDHVGEAIKESSGSILFFVAPQLNYVLHEKWNLSFILDIPVYQHFNGTQLGAGPGFTVSVSRTISYLEYSKINPY